MLHVIAVVAALLLIAACAPQRPNTYTPTPDLARAHDSSVAIRKSVTDAKDHLSKARTLSEQIDDKIIKLGP